VHATARILSELSAFYQYTFDSHFLTLRVAIFCVVSRLFLRMGWLSCCRRMPRTSGGFSSRLKSSQQHARTASAGLSFHGLLLCAVPVHRAFGWTRLDRGISRRTRGELDDACVVPRSRNFTAVCLHRSVRQAAFYRAQSILPTDFYAHNQPAMLLPEQLSLRLRNAPGCFVPHKVEGRFRPS
jgi:hypothetical protein